MAQILVFGNTKGGVGKSTLAFNACIALARQGREVLLVDSDRQQTAMLNTRIRTQELGQAGYTAITLFNSDVIQEVPKLASKYDDIIVDVGGEDNPGFRSALLIPNVLLVMPVKPRTYDLWGADDTAVLIKEARARGNASLRVVAFINEADHLHEADNEGAEQELREKEGIEVAPIRLVRRRAFPDAAAKGLSVVEYKDPKAIQEFEALLSFVHPHYNQTGVLNNGNRKKA